MGTRIDANPEKQYEADNGATLGIGTALNDDWNIEGTLQKLDPAGIAAQSQRSVGLDFQRVFRRDRRFSPYLFLGLGVLESELESGVSDDNAATYAGGMGFFAKIFGSSDVALRAEYRHREDQAFSFRGDDELFSLGLQIPVGRKAVPIPVPVADPDSDGDGVPNSRDLCANTPTGSVVDATGCVPVRDADGDGVPDGMDQCPDTMAGAQVDPRGCELDGDNDGVVNRLDRCLETRADAIVDVYGCEIRNEISLPGVNFETNSDRLLPAAIGILEDAVQTLRNNPSLTVEVAGHTDSDGAANYNLALSQRRAIAVREFFISRGIAASRVTARGYGEAEPIAANTTAAGKASNRRVVLRVLTR